MPPKRGAKKKGPAKQVRGAGLHREIMHRDAMLHTRRRH